MSTEHHHYGSVSVAVSVDRLNHAAQRASVTAKLLVSIVGHIEIDLDHEETLTQDQLLERSRHKLAQRIDTCHLSVFRGDLNYVDVATLGYHEGTCAFCGIKTASPCDESPPDTCEKAINTTHGSPT